MFTRLRNRMAGNTFALSCIGFIVVMAVALMFFFGCSHIQSPIKINVNQAELSIKPIASSLGYVIAKKNPTEAGIIVLLADVMMGEEAPLQEVVTMVTEKLDRITDDPYLRLQGKHLLDSLGLEMVDGRILVEQGNELIQMALQAFVDGMRAAQGVN